MTLEEATNYYITLVEAINGNETTYFKNTDRVHNCEIMRSMLNESNEINMFCGEMSVFRKGFYRHIDNDPAHQNNVDNIPLGTALQNQLNGAIEHFLQNENNSLRIVLERYKASYTEDLIENTLISRGIRQNTIQIRTLNDNTLMKDNIDHFSFCTQPNISRIEQDKENRSALCAVKLDDENIKSLRQVFMSLWNIAEPIPC